jgi:hypothetical protein
LFGTLVALLDDGSGRITMQPRDAGPEYCRGITVAPAWMAKPIDVDPDTAEIMLGMLARGVVEPIVGRTLRSAALFRQRPLRVLRKCR